MIYVTGIIKDGYFLSWIVAAQCRQQKQEPGNAKFQDPLPSYRFIVLLISSLLSRFFHSLSQPLGASTGPLGLKCVSCVLGGFMPVWMWRKRERKGVGPSVPWRRRLSWGTRTHLALMLLGCPAVRVRGTTRPHPFKASPGKRPFWKPRLSMREGPNFFFFFPPFVPPWQKRS